ncbi:MAG: hypothetical protein ACT4QA_09145 [Panacagrimonas sp.]
MSNANAKRLVSRRLVEPRRRLQVSDDVSEDDYAANASNAKEISLVDSVERKYLTHLMLARFGNDRDPHERLSNQRAA